MSSRGTLVEQVRGQLLTDLSDGVFHPGAKLPNEHQLAERYEVSRITIREAVGSLVDSGLLSRRHGSGTYVTGKVPRRHSLETTLSYTAMIVDAGMRAGETVLSRQVRPATAEEALRLGVPAGQPLICLERIRTADERPVIYSLDRILEDLVSSVQSDQFDSSLYAVLELAGCGVRSASARLTPMIANTRLSQLLQVRRGSPLLHIDEVDYDEAGHAVMLSAEWHVPDVFEMHVNRRVSQAAPKR
jgi:GntR family transcriptional regulator